MRMLRTIIFSKWMADPSKCTQPWVGRFATVCCAERASNRVLGQSCRVDMTFGHISPRIGSPVSLSRFGTCGPERRAYMSPEQLGGKEVTAQRYLCAGNRPLRVAHGQTATARGRQCGHEPGSGTGDSRMSGARSTIATKFGIGSGGGTAGRGSAGGSLGTRGNARARGSGQCGSVTSSLNAIYSPSGYVIWEVDEAAAEFCVVEDHGRACRD
jgi:hypothetical protein